MSVWEHLKLPPRKRGGWRYKMAGELDSGRAWVGRRVSWVAYGKERTGEGRHGKGEVVSVGRGQIR